MGTISPKLQEMIATQPTQANTTTQKVQQPKVDLTQKPDTVEISANNKTTNTKTNKKKKAAIIASIIAGVLATAGIVYAVVKGKNNKPQEQIHKLSEFGEKNSDAFKKIQADKFTGKIECKTGTGKSNTVLEYTDGVLKKSTVTGEKNFEKVYETINNEKIVKTTQNGVTTTFNLTQRTNEVKAAQEKLKALINDDTLSSGELQKQADAIKYKSNEDKEKIANKVQTKAKAEKIKQEAERVAQEKAIKEAQEKAKAEAEKAKQKTEATVQNNVKPVEAEMKVSTTKDVTNSNIEISKDDFIIELQEHLKKQGFSDNEIEQYSKNILNRYYNGELTNEEHTIASHHGKAYGFNNKLRCGEDCSEAQLLDIEFKHLKPTEEIFQVKRGVSGNKFMKENMEFVNSLIELKEGQTFFDHGFSHASFKNAAPEHFSQGDIGAILNIEVPKGAKVSRAPSSVQAECLFPRHAQFKVIKPAVKIKNGLYEIFLEYILPAE